MSTVILKKSQVDIKWHYHFWNKKWWDIFLMFISLVPSPFKEVFVTLRKSHDDRSHKQIPPEKNIDKYKLKPPSVCSRTLWNNLAWCLEKEGTHQNPWGLSYQAFPSHNPESIFCQFFWFFNEALNVGMDVGCTACIQGHVSNISKAAVKSAYLEV